MKPKRDVTAMLQGELDKLTLDDLTDTTAMHPDMKIKIHELIINYAKSVEKRGERFDLTKHEFGQLVVLEGLIIMSSATAELKQQISNN